jgi:hypothetical protein
LIRIDCGGSSCCRLIQLTSGGSWRLKCERLHWVCPWKWVDTSSHKIWKQADTVSWLFHSSF